MFSKQFVFLLVLPCVLGLTYPLYGGNRHAPSTSRRQSPFIPMVNTRREYQVPDYEDSYVPGDQLDFDYYDKYDPYMRYGGASLVPFYRPSEYYSDQIPRRNLERVNYYDEPAPAPQDATDEDIDGMYPDEAWYDDPATADINRAFIRNLVLSQMYQDAKNSPAYRYDLANEDYNGNKYEYGIPTVNAEELEKARRYFEEKNNEDVKELEALARKQGTNEEMFNDKENTEKFKDVDDVAEKELKNKMSDAQDYFSLQKQMALNNRKSNEPPVADGFRLDKKQVYDPTGQLSKFYDFETFPDETTTNSIKKLNVIKEKDAVKESSTLTTLAAPSTTASSQNPAKAGQKEVVLPRPSNPARKPNPEIATRSMNPPSVYDTIKKLLDMEKEAENKDKAQPQKRFVMTEDPLTAELAELKKSSA